MPQSYGLAKAPQDQPWCWKPVGRERSQRLACLVTRGHVVVAGRRAAQKTGTTTKALQAWWKWLPQPQLSRWPCAGHVAHSQTSTIPWISPPMRYPPARADPSKQLLELKGCFPILLQGSGAVSTLMARTWLQSLLSWQNRAQKSMLNLKPECQHPKLVV